MHLVRLFIGAALLLITISGCRGEMSESTESQDSLSPPPCTNVDPVKYVEDFRKSLPEQLAKGERIGYKSYYGAEHVYASEPFDVARGGSYVFRLGPVRPDFIYPAPPPGGGLVISPPDDFQGRFKPGEDSYVKMVGEPDGTRYIEASLNLTGDVPPCTGLVMFVY